MHYSMDSSTSTFTENVEELKVINRLYNKVIRVNVYFVTCFIIDDAIFVYYYSFFFKRNSLGIPTILSSTYKSYDNVTSKLSVRPSSRLILGLIMTVFFSLLLFLKRKHLYYIGLKALLRVYIENINIQCLIS